MLGINCLTTPIHSHHGVLHVVGTNVLVSTKVVAEAWSAEGRAETLAAHDPQFTLFGVALGAVVESQGSQHNLSRLSNLLVDHQGQLSCPSHTESLLIWAQLASDSQPDVLCMWYTIVFFCFQFRILVFGDVSSDHGCRGGIPQAWYTR